MNNIEGSIILDTCLHATILFKFKNKIDSTYKNLRKITLNGFIIGSSIEAIVMVGNTFQLGEINALKQRELLVLDEHVNLSSKMGMTINGMIG